MTGFLRDYLLYIFAAFIILIGAAFVMKGGFSMTAKGMAEIGLYEIVLSLVMVSATIATVFAKSRLTAIISLGVVGYTLALFFVIFRAPDLALTRSSLRRYPSPCFFFVFTICRKCGEKEDKNIPDDEFYHFSRCRRHRDNARNRVFQRKNKRQHLLLFHRLQP